jgi:hypothetical protein
MQFSGSWPLILILLKAEFRERSIPIADTNRLTCENIAALLSLREGSRATVRLPRTVSARL